MAYLRQVLDPDEDEQADWEDVKLALGLLWQRAGLQQCAVADVSAWRLVSAYPADLSATSQDMHTRFHVHPSLIWQLCEQSYFCFIFVNP